METSDRVCAICDEKVSGELGTFRSVGEKGAIGIKMLPLNEKMAL